MFPSNITVVRGENVYLKLREVSTDQKECLYRSPGNEDLAITPNDRIKSWNEGGLCAITITDIQMEDAGFWRLTSKNDDYLIRGISIVNVVQRNDKFPAEIDDIVKFEDITPQDTNYCYVHRTNNEYASELSISEKCYLPDHILDPKAQGVFNVIAGIKGQTKEITFEINIETKGIHLFYIQQYNTLFN